MTPFLSLIVFVLAYLTGIFVHSEKYFLSFVCIIATAIFMCFICFDWKNQQIKIEELKENPTELHYNSEKHNIQIDTTYIMNIKKQNDKILYEYCDTLINYKLIEK